MAREIYCHSTVVMEMDHPYYNTLPHGCHGNKCPPESFPRASEKVARKLFLVKPSILKHKPQNLVT